MTLIGLHGKMRSGKDTIADWLGMKHRFARMSLAGPIKDGLITMLGLTRGELEDAGTKEAPIPWLGKSPRELMQTLGTEWGRQMVANDLWIRVARRRLSNYRKFALGGIVVTDVRFANEAEWIRAEGGQVWHVLRQLPANVRSLHASEACIPIAPGVDSIIDNSAGLEQLYDEVDRALKGECIVEVPAA